MAGLPGRGGIEGNPQVTQDDLAGRLSARGVSLDRSAVSRIESRERYVMDYEALAIAAALKVSIEWLFDMTEDERK